MNNVRQEEIDQFSEDSSHWWDPNGPFKPLHKLNPVRVEYIRNMILGHFGSKKLNKLSLVDVGCGGGLVCEPFARQGLSVSGLDADENAINVANEHAIQQGLNINYQVNLIEDVKKTYDVVLALEIIEHVPEPEKFVQDCLRICKPGGIIIFSTLNRTAKSYALGIVAAEYILNWVPKGTHNWKQFIKPSELAKWVRENKAEVKEISGLRYHPLSDRFSMDAKDVDVNYFLVAGEETSASRK